ncbi:MAG: ZIP family metal transporter [Proteiniphilum sp.]|jgi:ZIP family zinc transporter|nr:ZIP family metal transporter [Proteiniphilum sp.]
MLDNVIQFLENIHPVRAALYATLFTWLVTALGASFVFLFKRVNKNILDGMLGFSGGVMVAASAWSLIIPAIEMSGGTGFVKVLPTVTGFLAGSAFLYGIDKVLPHLHVNFKTEEGLKTPWQRTTLMALAITLHNIPEGLAVGVLFGGVAAGMPEASLGGAVALALGIGLQNFPEGIAVAIPLRRMGLSRSRSFMYGQASAAVEPVAGLLGALAVAAFTPILPYALAFAAGAMIFVVVEEVIPEAQQNKSSDIATIGFIIGFVVMMVMDVVLG